MRILLLPWIVLGLRVCLAVARDIFVPLNGSIQACVDEAENENDVATRCILEAGVYREKVVIRASARVEILGVGERTILSGTEVVPDQWQAHSGHIYSVKLPQKLQVANIQQVFGDNVWMPEARWPNVKPPAADQPANFPGGPLSLASWASTCNGTDLRKGKLVSTKLNASGVNWTGALATVNVGFRFFTWTRRVLDSGPGSIEYDPHCASTGNVGGKGHYMDKVTDGFFFLSGKLGALDAPGEWFIDEATWTMYVWMMDSQAPGARVSIKTLNFCIDAIGSPDAPVVLTNLAMHGCTFSLRKCNHCAVQGVDLRYPTYAQQIPNREVEVGEAPPMTLLEGNDSLVVNFTLRYTNNGGLKIAGSRNTVREALIEDTAWLGSLDFPSVLMGFTNQQPTAIKEVGTPSSGDDVANDNLVTRVTIRRMGNSGIVTSQRSNEISFAHVYDVGLIGLDHAGIHADNTPISCMNYRLPSSKRSNCTKVWHHNWVHDCREKCVRGDDYSLNLTLHHTVAFNCGKPLSDANVGAATGVIMKGDYNRYWANTVFNVSDGQGDLCIPTKGLHPAAASGRYNITQQNEHSTFFNSANANVTTQGGPSGHFPVFDGMWSNEAELGLSDPIHFDFRPRADSPLRHAGIVHPPEALAVGGQAPDIGAYQFGAEKWVPGCTAFQRCTATAMDRDIYV